MVLVIIATIRYLIIRTTAFGLVDEVFDAGDALIVRNGGIEDQIPLSDIINVSYSGRNSPPHVTLMLRAPSRFGDRVSFCAPTRFMRFSLSPELEELIWRIDAARRGRRA